MFYSQAQLNLIVNLLVVRIQIATSDMVLVFINTMSTMGTAGFGITILIVLMDQMRVSLVCVAAAK